VAGPTAAAIANALADAIGLRMRHLPFTPERLMQALQESEDA
jgi:CO/xanthine dehydrogenase Mo-binding subunit